MRSVAVTVVKIVDRGKRFHRCLASLDGREHTSHMMLNGVFIDKLYFLNLIAQNEL